MTEQRKQEIRSALQGVIDAFVLTDEYPILDMFGLISRYNSTGKNVELIGGDWATANGFDL